MAELLLLEGDDLPELMARVRDQLGPRATIVRAERVRSGGIGGFFSHERYELTVEVADPPRPAPRSVPVRPASGDPLEALLDAADRAEAGEGDEAGPAVSTSGARFAAVLEHVRALAGPSEAAAVAAPAAAPAPAPRVADPVPAQRGQSWGQIAAGLVAAGVPGELLDQTGSFADVLDRVPEPPLPPRRPGQVLVLVGAREAVASVAILLRHQWRLPDEAVVEAGAAGLTSSAALVRWRVRTGEADHAWLLVVDAPDDDAGRRQATGLVAAAQPDQVWAVVDARTKGDDAARWLAQVGAARRPDALAVCGLLETSAPGTLLGLGLPVAWADGLPASRILWAAVLGQTVEAALRR